MEKPIYRFLHIIFALGTLHLMVLVGLETQRFFQNRSEIKASQASIERLEQNITTLTGELEAAQTSEYREAMARRMGYVQKDERLFLDR